MNDLVSDLDQLEASVHELRTAGVQAHALLRKTQRLAKVGTAKAVLERLGQLQHDIELIAKAWAETSRSAAAMIDAARRRWRH